MEQLEVPPRDALLQVQDQGRGVHGLDGRLERQDGRAHGRHDLLPVLLRFQHREGREQPRSPLDVVDAPCNLVPQGDVFGQQDPASRLHRIEVVHQFGIEGRHLVLQDAVVFGQLNLVQDFEGFEPLPLENPELHLGDGGHDRLIRPKGRLVFCDPVRFCDRLLKKLVPRCQVTGPSVFQDTRNPENQEDERGQEGLEFIFDAITSPLFDMEEMEREREVIMNEYDRGVTHPFHNLTLAMEEVIYIDAPWRQSPIGVPDVIQAAAPPAMHAFQELYYTPDNSALIIAGDVDYEEAFRLAEDQFAGWEYGGRSNYDNLPRLISIERDTIVYVDSPSGAGYVSVIYEGPSISTDPGDSYPADVWGSYLSLMSREFYTDLVTNGPFINVYGSYYTQRFSPSITFAGMVPPDRAEEALDLLLEEIQQLQSPDYYDEEGIELAKEELYRHRILAEETSRDVAVESMPFWWVVAGSRKN